MWSIASLTMCQHVIKMHVMLKKTFELHYSYSLVNMYYTINVNSVHLIMVFKKLVYDKHNDWRHKNSQWCISVAINLQDWNHTLLDW